MPISLPAVTAWSYSRYSDYKRCPAFFMYKHLQKLPTEGSPAMDRGNVIHKLAEDFTAGKLRVQPPELKYFAEQFAQLRKLKPLVEQEWGFKSDWAWTGRPGWFGPDVWFRAKCDVAVVYDDNTGEVVDHKTGKKYEVNEDQVELFAAASFRRFPKLTKITTRLWYLDIANDDENEVIREYTKADAALIEKDWSKRVVPMFVDKRYPPKPNQWCFRCDFSKGKGGPCKF